MNPQGEKSPAKLIQEFIYGAMYTTAVALIFSSLFVFLSTKISTEFTFGTLIFGAILSFLSSMAVSASESLKKYDFAEKFYLYSAVIQFVLGCISLFV